MFDLPVLGLDSIGLESISIDTSLTADCLPAPNVACWFLLLILLARFLKIFHCTEAPIITLNESAKNKQDGQVSLKEVLANCPILRDR
jgi:hypothetical protein